MPVNLHPEVHPEVQDSELASYGGWDEQEVNVQKAEQPAQSRASEPMPLLDDDDRVTPKQVQQDRPWWMRPTPRMIVAGGTVMALLYVLFSIFGLWGSPRQGSPTTVTTVDPAAIDQEVESRLNELQTENENLKREQLMGEPLQQGSPQSQPTKPVPVQGVRSVSTPPPPRVVSTSAPRPSYATQSARPSYTTQSVAAQSPTPRLVTRPITSNAPRPVSTKPSATAKVQPEVDPMERWLAAANMGHYVAPKGDAAYGSEAQPVAYNQANQANQASGYPTAASDSSTPDQASSYSPTGSGSSIPDQASTRYPSTTSDSPSYPSSPSSDIPTYEPLEPQRNASSQQAQTLASAQMQSQSEYPAQSIPTDPNQLLDIGSSANAVLESGIAWTPDGPEQNLRHLLRLEEGFVNRLGAEVLPKDTYLIAQVTERSDSGLFFMEVTHILRGPNREKVPVPTGALQVLGEDGSPLKAELKKKGGSGFWNDAAAIAAPGIERAMGAVADSADSLILEDGDRSLIQTSGDRSNPLASGISGVANGVSQVFGSRLNSVPSNTSVPYFKFDPGETVRVSVNEDVQL